MRWLMIAFLVSLVVLLAISAGVAHHVWREHSRRRTGPIPPQKAEDTETEEAP